MKLTDFVRASGVWVLPFGLAAFVFALLLLIAGSLPEPVRRWTLPSLAVYLVGLGSIIFLKELAHRRHLETWAEGERKNLPTGKLWFFVTLHVVWLGLLITYNFWRGAL